MSTSSDPSPSAQRLVSARCRLVRRSGWSIYRAGDVALLHQQIRYTSPLMCWTPGWSRALIYFVASANVWMRLVSADLIGSTAPLIPASENTSATSERLSTDRSNSISSIGEGRADCGGDASRNTSRPGPFQVRRCALYSRLLSGERPRCCSRGRTPR